MTQYYDWDFNTIFQWKRVELNHSHASIYWKIDKDEQPGFYRIIHHGHYRYKWNRKIYSYEGESKMFEVDNRFA